VKTLKIDGEDDDGDDDDDEGVGLGEGVDVLLVGGRGSSVDLPVRGRPECAARLETKS